MTDSLLAGRTAVVTGGAQGLGRAIVERFAAAGARCHVVDLPSALGGISSRHAATGIDLAAPDAEAELARLAAGMDRVDIVIANAGVVPPWRGIAALDRDEWERVFTINVWGVAATLKAFAGPLAASGRGSAVLMASLNGQRAHADQPLYTASKHAVVGLARAAALDLGRQGVRVNALAPGPVATEALVGRVAERHASGGLDVDAALGTYAAGAALGRIATEADIANAALFLASDLAAGVSGVVLPVDCGIG